MSADEALLRTESEINLLSSPSTRRPGDAAPAGLAGPRYDVGRMIGSGATSQVFVAHDRALDREVALKVLAGGSGPAIARFMREARITAAIDHPNVVGVHDLEFAPGGTASIIMRRIEGTSLGDELRSGPIRDVNRLVTMLLKVCDALAGAHDRGIIHRDLKPDNIMLGKFGEVVVLDWGESRVLGDDAAQTSGNPVGTPAYMSPEQARGEAADQRSDIYCLAATAWFALTGSHPVMHADPAVFWERKRNGAIDELPSAVARSLPRRLLAILRKGLSAVALERYQTIADFAGDLSRYQAGQSVTAYRERLFEMFGAYLRRHARAIASVLLVLLTLAAASWWISAERQRSQATWGEPVISEDFSDDGWKGRWHAPTGSLWRRDAGRLVSDSPGEAVLVLRRRLSGVVAIEYDACMMPGFQPGDLSVMWSEVARPLGDAAPDVRQKGARSFAIQAGAWGNQYFRIIKIENGSSRTDQGSTRLDVLPGQMQSGTWYHMRIELDGCDMRMWVDGRLILQHRDLLPIADGYLSLYGFYPGKAFDNVRVWHKNVPELVSALHVGDSALRHHAYAMAAAEYQHCLESFPGSDIGAEAAYKWGVALDRAGRRTDAHLAWQQVPAGPWRDRVAVEVHEDAWRAGRYDEAARGMIGLCATAPAEQSRLRLRWMEWYHARPAELEPGSTEAATALRRIHETCFPKDPTTAEYAAQLLREQGSLADVLTRFPDEPFSVTVALMGLGRDQELLSRFPYVHDKIHDWALMRLARYEDVIARQRDIPSVALALALSGRAQEACQRYPEMPFGWLYAGDLEQAVAKSGLNPEFTRVQALFAAGRFADVEALLDAGSITTGRPYGVADRHLLALFTKTQRLDGDWERESATSLAWITIRLLAAGRQEEAKSARTIMQNRPWVWFNSAEWIPPLVIRHLPELAAGDPGPLRSSLVAIVDQHKTKQSGRPWFLAARALGLIDDAAVLGQPTKAEARAWLEIAKALQAEMAGDAQAASGCWAAYLALPRHERLLAYRFPSPVIEALAEWRAAKR